MTTPRERYQRDLGREGFVHDPAQAMAVEHLQRLYDELMADVQRRGKNRFMSMLGVNRKPREEAIRGLYFWGGVGRGKTYLMDTFFECLPFQQKLRLHFHRFMRRVHQDMKVLQGAKNPLEKVADGIAAEARVLCFDEFYVSDIADAMVLGALLQHLFDRGVTLIATSNIPPDHLYENGLQRARFLPAIEQIKQRTHIVRVDGGFDYRLRVLERAQLYHSPLDSVAALGLQRCFDDLAPEPAKLQVQLAVEGRQIVALRVSDGVAWFAFSELCEGPRSQNDFIELAREFHTILIENIPKMGESKDDSARRFISLVDEFYDRNVRLVISAEVPLDQLYCGGGLDFQFQRTRSRLLEMQSREYLSREHLS